MNVHDSERISGLLDQAGYVKLADSGAADGVTPGAYAAGARVAVVGGDRRESRPVAARRFGPAVTLGP